MYVCMYVCGIIQLRDLFGYVLEPQECIRSTCYIRNSPDCQMP